MCFSTSPRDPQWFGWSSARLAPLVNARQAAINPVIYAELASYYKDEPQP